MISFILELASPFSASLFTHNVVKRPLFFWSRGSPFSASFLELWFSIPDNFCLLLSGCACLSPPNSNLVDISRQSLHILKLSRSHPEGHLCRHRGQSMPEQSGLNFQGVFAAPCFDTQSAFYEVFHTNNKDSTQDSFYNTPQALHVCYNTLILTIIMQM